MKTGIKTQPSPSASAAVHQFIAYLKNYFLHSNDRFKASLLLGGAVLSVIAIIALNATYSIWLVSFWSALNASNVSLFLASMKSFAFIISSYVMAYTVNNYFLETLTIRWRNWLTDAFTKKYLKSQHNYLELKRFASNIDNPQQRIQEDIVNFVRSTLSLSLDFFKSICSLGIFIGTLWVLGGSLTFGVLGLGITIPGYLVWAALLFALTASLISHKIGHRITELTDHQEDFEANFRKELVSVEVEAEKIAQEHAENYFERSLREKFKLISENAYQLLRVRLNLTAFQNFYLQASFIFPYLTASPLYFSGVISIGQLMQIGFAFGEVQLALSWFINSYERIMSSKTSWDRIIALENALKAGLSDTFSNHIVVEKCQRSTGLVLQQLHIQNPQSTASIVSNVNFTLKQGENTLMKAPSGFGKSTLFKALAENWPYGQGKISLPADKKMYFLPQKPMLPEGALRAILAYPETVDTYKTEAYIDALKAVHLDAYIALLDTTKNWENTFSPGQQQLILFARTLLKKPDWLFLDESTAWMDPENERLAYTLLKKKLPQTTVVSIAHRPSVTQFHSRTISLGEPKKKKKTLSTQSAESMTLPTTFSA